LLGLSAVEASYRFAAARPLYHADFQLIFENGMVIEPTPIRIVVEKCDQQIRVRVPLEQCGRHAPKFSTQK
jgi:hypothetical protein